LERITKTEIKKPEVREVPSINPVKFHEYDDDIINEDQKGEDVRSGEISRPSSKNLYLSSTPTDLSSDNELRT